MIFIELFFQKILVPISPEKRQLIISNSSSTLIKLSAFKAALCPITGFEIKYKLQQDTEWIEISNLEGRFAPSFELIELKPASWYDLIVKAFSEAGSTQIEYSFSTLTASGGKKYSFKKIENFNFNHFLYFQKH